MNPKITKFKILFILIYAFNSYLNAATYTVTNTNDAGANSLREALTNAQGAGADVIEFNIAGAGPHTINISSALPQITDDNTFINGLTQIGSSYNTPMIVINGTSAGVSVTGIYINGADNNKIAGIVCQAFNGHGFRIHDGNNNIIQNCFSGTNAAGTSSVANNLNGIMISGASSGNIIGTDSDGTNDNQEANLLSGNTQSGVEMNGINVINNRISGNIIGLNITGNAALGNTQNGVSIASGAKRNLIGTDGNGTNDYNERNVISSNRSGISINGSSGGARENKVAGNFIGTAIDGITDLGNTLDGIVMTSLTKANLIGTNADGVSDALERNIIAGNNQYGVNFSGVDSNVVAGNYIGLDSTGSVILRNNEWGVQIQNSDYNLIGTNGDLVRDAVERNVISGNGFSGIGIRSLADYNKVFGNYIGLDYTGEVDLGNTQSGVQIREGASFNVVGGTATNLLNHISGNTLHGVHIFTQYPAFIGAGPRTNNNTVDANIIGLDVNLVPVGNGQNGIFTELAVNSTLSNNTIFNNGANGILNRGAESSITNNNIRNNGASGIQVTFHIGANGDVNAEFASANDIISSVAISGNTIINNCGTANPCAGIYGFDDFIDPLVNDKGVTLETNNTIGINNGKPDVQQDWHGAIEVVNTGATIVDMPYLVYSNGTGPTYTLTDTVATLGTYGTTYLHGPSGINMTNIYTWKLFTEYIVDPSGISINYTPNNGGGVSYSFDGNAATNPSNSGVGYNAEGITSTVSSHFSTVNSSFSISRYQILEGNYSALPLENIILKANPKLNSVVLEFQINDINTNEFIIEKSYDGINYFEFNSLKYQSNISHYQFTDLQINNDKCFYRIKANNHSQKLIYSNIQLVKFNENFNKLINIYPNPTTSNINIESNFEINSVELFNHLGQLVLISNQKEIDIYSLPSGIYTIIITSSNDEKLIEKITLLK